MPKTATELMQEILFSAFLDSVDALKAGSNGLPNLLVRELNSIHRNTTFADLPKEVQDAILTNVRGAFTKLLKEGYSVGLASAGARPAPAPRAADGRSPMRDRPRRPDGPKPRGPEGPRGGGNRPKPRG
ncbi:hypothetical protein [Sphingomonas xinjiangensis]|uniref:Uncharacterized protein n=1 Tax=Sphingomonas xinjiangensis TaxID=643568 RepID=A0A840YNQ6_9SPHN|nr:hypothetical protein [Sphingomonas xinjiangensis]MBB5709192.1 hypothetical protein [Sphingomonas xinjiangensis]